MPRKVMLLKIRTIGILSMQTRTRCPWYVSTILKHFLFSCFRSPVLNFILSLSFLLILSGCCTNCLIAKSELAGQKDLEQTNPKATELWADNIDAVITSDYGGNVNSYTISEVSPIIQLPGYFNSDLLMSCDSGRQLGVKSIDSYNSERKAIVKIVSSLTDSSLKLEKTYRMNFDTGDIYISKDIVNIAESDASVEAIQKISLAKGGFLLMPVNVASQYPNSYRVVNTSGDDITAEASENSLRIDNKLVCYVDLKSEFSISSDSTEGWFGYFYKNTILLVKYSPFYTNAEKKGAVVFKADVTKDSIIVSFGETARTLPDKNSRLRIYEKLAIIKLKGDIKNFADVQEALNYLKVNLIVRR